MDNRRGAQLAACGRVQPREAVNAAQHTTVNLLKTLRDSFVVTGHGVFNVWPKTILLLPLWPRDAKGLDLPGRGKESNSRAIKEAGGHLERTADAKVPRCQGRSPGGRAVQLVGRMGRSPERDGRKCAWRTLRPSWEFGG